MIEWTLFSTQPAFYISVAAVLGLVVGSFLNVVIHRLPIMMMREWRAQCADLRGEPPPLENPPVFNLMTPPSRCPVCARPIRALENIPVISYLVMRGHCACELRMPISLQYPLVELASGLLTAITIAHFGWNEAGFAACVLTWALIALSVIDLHHQLLPDSITLTFVWLGLGLALFHILADLQSSVIGAMAGYLALWSVYQVFFLLTGKEGMGFGDFKLLAMLGAWQGWQALPAIVILSSVVGATVGIALILGGRHQSHVPLPFGPFLAVAGWITLLWGDAINRSYINWLGV